MRGAGFGNELPISATMSFIVALVVVTSGTSAIAQASISHQSHGGHRPLARGASGC